MFRGCFHIYHGLGGDMSWKAVVIDLCFYTVLVLFLMASGWVVAIDSIYFWISALMLSAYPDVHAWIKRRF